MRFASNPFLSLDHDAVLGHLKRSGTLDPDLLHSHERALIARGRIPKLVGIALTLIGLPCTVAVSTWIGLPLMILGVWLWRRGIRNLETIEACHAEYVGAVPRSG